MKYLLPILIVLSLITPAFATYVKPHFTKNGTFVSGHYRSKPNKTKLDNYSYRWNSNTYTAKKGKKKTHKTE